MPREILRITPETTQGVYNSGGTPLYVDLPQDDSFTMRQMPDQWITRAASADNLRTLLGSAAYKAAGKLNVYCRAPSAAFLMNMLTGLTGSICRDLPTYTLDHGIVLENACTYYYARYLGTMAAGGFSLDDSGGNGSLMMLNLDLYAGQVTYGTSYTTPPYNDYYYSSPPWQFQQARGGLSIGGVSRVNFSSLAFDSGNNIKQFRGENGYATFTSYRGRDPKLTISNLYVSSADRTAYNASAETAASVTFTDAAGDTLVFAMGNANYYTSVSDKLPIGDLHYQTFVLENFLDPSPGTDMSVTYTPFT